jgi:taurine dioxygenase
MSEIQVAPLSDDLAFGSRVSGVTEGMLKDPAVRARLNELFEDRGLIVFEGVEPTVEMQLAISDVFGPLKDHPVKIVPRVDQKSAPGVIEMRRDPETTNTVELDGVELAGWLPWHFDHCYNDELNRAGVLRAVDIPPSGGLTGFADGIQLYKALSPDLQERIEPLSVIYTLDLLFSHMRFGKPHGFRELRPQSTEILEVAKTFPRALHPAVWTRPTGEKVLHVSGWHSVGIEGHEDPDGDALLEAVCQEIIAKVKPYFHAWKPTDMLIWDNWRMLHAVSGHDPQYLRTMQRTTIKGDYGLGRFEDGATRDPMLEMTL